MHNCKDEVALAEYIPYNDFRTVLEECRDIKCGISEIPVIIELKKDSVLYKSGCLPSFYDEAMFIYGFIVANNKLKKIFSRYFKNIQLAHASILLNEWDSERFIMSFVYDNETEKISYSVKSNDIKSLLKNCRNPNIEIIS